eukprot:COSAG02_NODE_37766_length_437_cov_10.011834_1_plen_68_part_10
MYLTHSRHSFVMQQQQSIDLQRSSGMPWLDLSLCRQCLVHNLCTPEMLLPNTFPLRTPHRQLKESSLD